MKEGKMSTNSEKTSTSFTKFSPKAILIVNALVLTLNSGEIFSQSPNANSGLIYSMNGMTIQNYDPSLPISASNPVNNSISLPPGASGLAVCYGISSGSGSGDRFYTTLAGNYYYWDGNNWTNTGHSTGDPSAVNIGGGGNYIYNLVGSTGDIYKYDGNGDGTLVASLPGFTGNGPYDMVVDNNGNFYMLQTTIPQSLKVYNPNGVEICSYNLVGMPNLWAGGGYAIIGDQLYVNNGSLYVGTFSGTDINFTSTASPVNNPSDFASNPFNYVDVIQASISNVGTLGCSSPTVGVSATTNLGSANFMWTGPGILSGLNASSITANLAGLYSCTVTPSNSIGCPAVASALIISLGIGVTPTIASSNALTCTNPTVQLTSSPSAALHTYTWTGNGIVSGANSQSAVVNTGGVYSVLVRNNLTGCVGTETINVADPINTLNISTNDATICIGDVASLTVNGNADSYTWNTCPTLNTTIGSTVIANPITCTSYTVTGTLGTCTTTAFANVVVNQLPSVTVLPCSATICTGLSGATFTASGADSFVWSNSNGLSSTNGDIVTANPSASTVYTVIGTANSCTNSTTFTVTTSSNLPLSVSPDNTTICEGSSATINASGASSYSWNNVSGTNSAFSVSPNATTVYTVTGTSGGCTGSKTFTVNVTPTPNVGITSNTTTICEGNSVNLYTNGASSFVWATNSSLNCSITGVVANPVSTTIYTVVGTNTNGSISCSDTKTVSIKVLPKTKGTIIQSQNVCEGSSVALLAGGGNMITWSPDNGLEFTVGGSVNASPLSSIIYTAEISNAGECPDTKTVSVTVNTLPLVNAGSDTTILYGDYLVLNGNGDGQLAWISGEALNCNQCSKAYVAPTNNTCYTLEVTDIKGCKNTAKRCVEVQKEFNFYFPNSFTPNGDGLNDVFKVVGNGIMQFEMYIYDRWGNLLYKTTDMNEGWDGTDHGSLCKNGTYVCKVKATDINDKSEIRYGNITLYSMDSSN